MLLEMISHWLGNSLKQLKNDFLLYGKFNVVKLQDIVQNSKTESEIGHCH